MNACWSISVVILCFFLQSSLLLHDCLSFPQEPSTSIHPTLKMKSTALQSHDSSSMGSMKVHFIFLIHGWMGNELEMGYIETSIRKQMTSNMNIVVYKPKCNVGKTFDGIELGADRLVQELSTFITHHVARTTTTSEKVVASLSIVGNSLGGLYARNLISKLPLKFTTTTTVQPVQVELIPMLFVTTVTPHLGCSQHTYVKIPRWLEGMIGRLFRRTGRDLFAANDDGIIYQMSTQSHYLVPLQQYKKRVAYSNAFQTDFQVPTATAAFLSPSSTYLHQYQSPSKHTHPNDIVATFLTQPNNNKMDTTFLEQVDTTTQMSILLDSLGWTKVFIDLRPHVPTYNAASSSNDNNDDDQTNETYSNPSLPKDKLNNGDKQLDNHNNDDIDEESTPMVSETGTTTTNNNGKKKCTREIWEQVVQERSSSSSSSSDSKNQGIWFTSQELQSYMSTSQNLHFPTGHSILIANTKNDFQAKFNAKGRPVVDYFVSELLKDILHYTYQHNENNHNHS